MVKWIDSAAAGRRRSERVRQGERESANSQREDSLESPITQRAEPGETKSEIKSYYEVLRERRAMTQWIGRKRKRDEERGGGGGDGQGWVPRRVVRLRYIV